jgi:histidinol dehydrogenase
MEVREVADLSPAERRGLFERSAGVEAVREDVESIVDRVREEGDVALREFTREFDGVELGSVEVTDEAARAYDRLDDDLRDAIDEAIANVRAFHEAQLPEDWRAEFDGRTLGRRFRPVESAGAYVPGGRAAYPSSAVMGVVPATVAGVDRVVVATPPAEQLNDVTLGAVHAAGADAVYTVGGAQAIAALAYGTESVEPVRTVVGPGNKYVTAAKAAVRNDVGIDFLAGPSEVLVVADGDADPELVATDVLAQAEHDPEAGVVVVTDDATLARTVTDAIEAGVEEHARSDVVRSALENDASGVFLARSMSEAILFAQEYAPEHLSVQVDEGDEETVLDRITDAGSVFLGPYTPVAAGDYATGTNHVLPTGGGARRTGGLSVDTFLRSTTVQRLDREALSGIADTVTTLAEAEGLEAHAESVRRRFVDDDEDANEKTETTPTE